MGNIQSGINQFISQAAVLSRLAPGFEQRKEAYKLSKEEGVLKKELVQNNEGLIKSRAGVEELNQMEKTNERFDDLYERQFHNKPTKQNYEKLLNSKKLTARTKVAYAQIKAAQQVEQKMSFDEFKKQLTVKDLPQNLQEKAYNEYTTSKK